VLELRKKTLNTLFTRLIKGFFRFLSITIVTINQRVIGIATNVT